MLNLSRLHRRLVLLRPNPSLCGNVETQQIFSFNSCWNKVLQKGCNLALQEPTIFLFRWQLLPWKPWGGSAPLRCLASSNATFLESCMVQCLVKCMWFMLSKVTLITDNDTSISITVLVVPCAPFTGRHLLPSFIMFGIFLAGCAIMFVGKLLKLKSGTSSPMS